MPGEIVVMAVALGALGLLSLLARAVIEAMAGSYIYLGIWITMMIPASVLFVKMYQSYRKLKLMQQQDLINILKRP